MPDSLNPPRSEPVWPADQVERRPVGDLVPYARNARTHSPEQIAQIAASMQEWGWTNPVLVDEDGSIIAGHGRVLAAEKHLKAGRTEYATIPTMTARGWTEAQKRAYVLADNQLALNAGWDEDLLRVELADLKDSGFALDLIGFSDEDLEGLMADGADDEDQYTRKILAPIYEPTNDKPPVSALIDDSKARSLKEQIDGAGLPDELADFLRAAADRHTVFNFARIADYYAHSEPEVQRLFEASALVIIDMDAAIEGGFVRLTDRLSELIKGQTDGPA